MEDKQLHTYGMIAESWGDVLRRIRSYNGGKWTLNQCIVMHAIHSHNLNGVDCTARGLAESENIPQQTVSNAIAALRAEGLVREEVHPDDGRIKLVFPTTMALERRNRVWSEAIGISSVASK